MTDWLNYHHLHYFWTVAKAGTIAAAAAKLRVAPSGISMQLKELEEQLGCRLFARRGRTLALTDDGKRVLVHADGIFARGEALLADVKGRARAPSVRLRIGVSDVVPKLVAAHLLAPLLEGDVSLDCR